MSRREQIQFIRQALDSMLSELSNEELTTLEDFIVNECDESYVDDDGNAPNIFRMVIDGED